MICFDNKKKGQTDIMVHPFLFSSNLNRLHTSPLDIAESISNNIERERMKAIQVLIVLFRREKPVHDYKCMASSFL